MKLRRHDRSVNGQNLSPFAAIKLNNYSGDGLKAIISTLRDENDYPEYCLIEGYYSSMQRIVEAIQDKYHIQWIGDHYCIASHKSPLNYYIPKAEASAKDHCFLLEMRGIKVLCAIIPEVLQAYDGIESDITIILNPWIDVISDYNSGVETEYEIIENVHICVTYIPFYQLEHLQACMRI
jgi:hypothetical protein